MNITLTCTAKTAKYKQQYITDLTFTADSSQSSDAYIFMMQQLPKNYKSQQNFIFSHVATPIDLQTYPIVMDPDFAYFRVKEIVLRVGSDFQVQSIVDNINKDVKALVAAVNFLQDSDSDTRVTAFSQSFS